MFTIRHGNYHVSVLALTCHLLDATFNPADVHAGYVGECEINGARVYTLPFIGLLFLHSYGIERLIIKFFFKLVLNHEKVFKSINMTMKGHSILLTMINLDLSYSLKTEELFHVHFVLYAL